MIRILSLFLPLCFAATFPARADVVLPIPDRKQDAASPPSGWCGETAIQEAAMHVGLWASQREIHRRGNSSHPDLYSNEIPTALQNLGVAYERYRPKKPGFAAYSDWARAAIDAGDPVIAGVKLLPSTHPDWGLDHIVLIVGYGPRGLLVNTTWGTQSWVSDVATQGISFKNAFYALRVMGLNPRARGTSARLVAQEESADNVNFLVYCTSPTSSDAYIVRIEKEATATIGRGPMLATTINPRSVVTYRCASHSN